MRQYFEEHHIFLTSLPYSLYTQSQGTGKNNYSKFGCQKENRTGDM